MSEEERKKRFTYRQKRKRAIMILSALLIAALVVTLFSGIISYTTDKSYYINYSEGSTTDYGVFLKENDFYEASYLGKDYAYIASLIDKVQATFNYKLKMDSANAVDFNYSYRVDSVVQIKDKISGKVLFAPVYNEIEEKSFKSTDNVVEITDFVLIDYAKYNDVAESFIKTYDLDGMSAELILKMHVNVTGKSEEFLNDKNSNSHIASVSIPLTTKTVEVRMSSSVPSQEQKILSYTTEEISEKFSHISVAFAIISALLAIVLWGYAYLSRNIDITYNIKIAKLVKSYKSFIQRLCNSFNTEGYKILLISSFDEMLEIRDTTQSPILMEENEDKTLTRFFIPTNTNLLYVHEIKVDDYDELYGNAPAAEFAFEEVQIEDVTEVIPVEDANGIFVETVLEEQTDSNAFESSDADDFEAEGTSDDAEEADFEYVDEEGKRIKIACKRSFTANLIQSNPQVKAYYSAIKNKILSYHGVKSRISWRCDSFNKGRQQLFKLKIRGKTICLYCAIDPGRFERSKYFHEEATAKAFLKVPMLVRVRSDRGLKRALGLIDLVMEEFSITKRNKHIEVDYTPQYPYETTAKLVKIGLVKLLLPDAVAAEPKPHHHVHKAPKTFKQDNANLDSNDVDESKSNKKS